MVETQEVRKPFMKVISSNLCSLSCQFYYRYETSRSYMLYLKKLLSKYIDFAVEAYEKDSKTSEAGRCALWK